MTILNELLDVGNGGTYQFDPTDQQWYRFYQDHREEVSQNAFLRPISREEIYPHRRDIQSYLEANSIDLSLTWIVKDLNKITDFTFTEDLCSQLVIPSFEHISELYSRYVSISG